MTRQPTPEELQRCAAAACLATGDEPTSEDINAARDAIANPSYARPGSWSAAVVAEWSRILAEATPDARDGEIAGLRQDRELAILDARQTRETLAQCEAALAGRDAEIARLKARLAMATTFRTNGHIDHGFGVVLLGSRMRPAWKVSRNGWTVEYLSADGQFRSDAYHDGVADFDSADAAFAALDAARGTK